MREWLENGQDYAQGVALYESHGKSRVVLTALRRGISDFTRQKLREELTKLAQAITSPVRTPQAQKAGHQAGQLVAKLASLVAKPVPVDEALREQRRAWFAERNYLHPQLELVATDAERLTMSLRILHLGELISQSYAGLVVLSVPQRLAHVTEEGEIRRLLANLRPRRSKLKKRPDRATDLAQVESEIKFLEQKLKRDGGEPKLHEGH